MNRAFLCSGAFLLCAAFGGCGSGSPTVAPLETPKAIPPVAPIAPSKSHVDLLLGKLAYDEAAPSLSVGKPAKFKARIVLPDSKKGRVRLHSGELYTGVQKAVSAAELTKDFDGDAVAARKKYSRHELPMEEMIVEGVVRELQPDNFSVILEGHEK